MVVTRTGTTPHHPESRFDFHAPIYPCPPYIHIYSNIYSYPYAQLFSCAARSSARAGTYDTWYLVPENMGLNHRTQKWSERSFGGPRTGATPHHTYPESRFDIHKSIHGLYIDYIYPCMSMSTIYIHSHVHTHIRTCFHVRVMRMRGPILYGIVHIYI